MNLWVTEKSRNNLCVHPSDSSIIQEGEKDSGIPKGKNTKQWIDFLVVELASLLENKRHNARVD